MTSLATSSLLGYARRVPRKIWKRTLRNLGFECVGILFQCDGDGLFPDALVGGVVATFHASTESHVAVHARGEALAVQLETL